MENEEKCEPDGSEPAAICKKIRELASARGLTNIEISRRSGLSYRIVHSIMHAQTTPKMTTLTKIAKALGVGIDEILGIHDEPAAQVAEAGVEYQTRSVLVLSSGWMDRLARSIASREGLIEGAVNVYHMGLVEALRPAITDFEKGERNHGK